MAAKRQDAWMPEDDMILAEVTLRHIRDGGTQLSAFEEVAEKLGRTPAACGFRWNSYLRKKYESAIQIAKSQRQKKSLERSRQYSNKPSVFSSSVRILDEDQISSIDPAYNLDNVIRFLRQLKNDMNELQRQREQLDQELSDREEQIQILEKENYEMKNQLNLVQSDYRLVNDDYRTLVQIMDRARKMSVLSEEEHEKQRFRMDNNGNLERVDK